MAKKAVRKKQRRGSHKAKKTHASVKIAIDDAADPEQELERKVDVNPEDIDAAIFDNPAMIAARAGQKMRSKRRLRLYFDTNDGVLHANGISVRVQWKEKDRNERQWGWEMTVKVNTPDTAGEAKDGTLLRTEHKCWVAGPRPNFDMLKDKKLKKNIYELLAGRKTGLLFSVDILRHVFDAAIETPDGQRGVVEVAVDQGQIVTPDHKVFPMTPEHYPRPDIIESCLISEVELERKEGPAELIDVATNMIMSAAPRSKVHSESKNDRGMALHRRVLDRRATKARKKRKERIKKSRRSKAAAYQRQHTSYEAQKGFPFYPGRRSGPSPAQPAKPQIELQKKFDVPADQMSAILDNEGIKALRGKQRVHSQKDMRLYYDTTDGLLHAQGVSVYLQWKEKNGAGTKWGWEMTVEVDQLNTAKEIKSEALSKTKYKCWVKGGHPNFEALEDPQLKKKIGGILKGQKPGLIFSVDVLSHVFDAAVETQAGKRGTVEVAVEQGQIVTPHNKLLPMTPKGYLISRERVGIKPVSEIAIRKKEGPAEVIDSASHIIQALIPDATLHTASKNDRGAALHTEVLRRHVCQIFNDKSPFPEITKEDRRRRKAKQKKKSRSVQRSFSDRRNGKHRVHAIA